MAKTKRATQRQKEAALQLLKENATLDEVAEKTKLTLSQLGGLIGRWRNQGLLQNYQPKETFVLAERVEAKKAKPSKSKESQPPKPPPVDDGFDWKPSAGSADGFSHQEVTYELERVDPPEGHLGRHSAPFTKEDIGRMYGGQCRYKLTKYVPGQRPESTEFPMSGTFGPPKTPKRFSEASADPQRRPDGSVQVDPNAGNKLRPGMWDRGAWPQQGQGWEGRLLEKIFGEMKSDKATPPTESPIILKLLDQKKDDADADKKRDDQRIKDEQERRDTLDREERTRRSTLESEHRTRQQDIEKEREAGHKREIDRIKAEQGKLNTLDDKFNDALKGLAKERADTLQELGQERTRLLEKQYKDREDLLKKQLDKMQEQVKEDREGIATELKDGQERIDREFELRDKAFDKHNQLEEKILAMRSEHQEKTFELLKQLNNGDTTSAIIEVIEKIATKAESAITKVTKTREMEIRAGKGGIPEETESGNISPDDEAPPQETETENGKDTNKEDDMKEVLDEILKTKQFQSIIEEWAKHVSAGNDSMSFANMYLEWMRDPRPEKIDTRQACSTFANSMGPRDWPEMLEMLRPHITDKAEILEVFEGENASEFYDGFKFIVLEHIRDYYQAYIEERRAAREARKSKKPAAKPTTEETEPAQTE